MDEDERQAKCKHCGEPIFLSNRKYRTVVVREATDEEMEKRTWRHVDGFKHCTLAKASPDDDFSKEKKME